MVRPATACVLTAVFLVSAPLRGGAQRARPRVSTEIGCVAPLGVGAKSRRNFCDVLIGTRPSESVALTIPQHTGTATLMFDLHNRFTLPAVAVTGPLTFAKHEAIVAVVKPAGEVVQRAAVVREFRAPSDLFDQITGGTRPGGVKAIGPGPAEPIRVVIPAGVSAVGIVGMKLDVMTRASEEVFDTPGRPVAIVSNVRVEYRP